MSAIRDLLSQHAAECDECETWPLPLDALASGLSEERVVVNASALSSHARERLRPEMERLAVRATWRRLAAAILLSLLPLPAILAYDAVVIRLAHAAISALVPATLATYVVGSYAALILLLFASTYAAIPLVVLRPPATRVAAR